MNIYAKILKEYQQIRASVLAQRLRIDDAMQRTQGRSLLWEISPCCYSVVQSYPTLCNSMDCSTPSFSVLHISKILLRLMTIQPFNHLILCPLLLLLPSVFPRIRVFSGESTLHIRWPQYWSFSFNTSPSSEYSGQISFRIGWFDLLAVQGTLKGSPVPQFEIINSSLLSLLYGLTLISVRNYWKKHNFDYADLGLTLFVQNTDKLHKSSRGRVCFRFTSRFTGKCKRRALVLIIDVIII